MTERQAILADLARTYRLYRRLEASLSKPPFNRVFKNPKCKTAMRLKERRHDILSDVIDLRKAIYDQWVKLPEVRQSKDLQMAGAALRFAAELVKPKRNPRYMRSQSKLPWESAQPEEGGQAASAISPAGA